jgi:hypothetical protein
MGFGSFLKKVAHTAKRVGEVVHRTANKVGQVVGHIGRVVGQIAPAAASAAIAADRLTDGAISKAGPAGAAVIGGAHLVQSIIGAQRAKQTSGGSTGT